MRPFRSAAFAFSIVLVVLWMRPGAEEVATQAQRALQAASYAAVAVPDAGEGADYVVTVPLALWNYPLVPDTTWSTTVVVQNASDDEAAVTLSLRDPAGSDVGSLDDSLPPRASRRYDPAALASPDDPLVGTLVITSERPPAVVVYAHEPNWADGLVSFEGGGEGATTLYANRVLNGFLGWTSRLSVANRSDLSASVHIAFYNHLGGFLASRDDILPPRGSVVYDPGSIPGVPDGLDGNNMAVVRANRAVEGAVVHLHQGSGIASGLSLSGSPIQALHFPSLARAYSANSTTSGYSVWNVGAGAATVAMAYYDTAGRGILAAMATVPAGQQRSGFLGAEPALPDGFIGSAFVSSDQPLVAEVSTMLALPAASMAYPGVWRANSTLYVPVVRRSGSAHTVLTVQNATAEKTSIIVSYYDQEGMPVARQSDELPAHSSHVYDQSNLADLGDDYWGSAVITADRAVAAVVQEYRRPASSNPTPTATATPTPHGTVTPAPVYQRIFLPLVEKAWPPLPARPVLHDISIGTCNDNDYGVEWERAERAVSFSLQEDDEAGFPSPTTVFQGTDTVFFLDGKVEGTYYYRVRGTNEWGNGPWSETKSVTVGPPMTLWTIVNNTGGDLTLDIPDIASRTFGPGQHTWCVPAGEFIITARAGCGSQVFPVRFDPYGSAAHEFSCEYLDSDRFAAIQTTEVVTTETTHPPAGWDVVSVEIG